MRLKTFLDRRKTVGIRDVAELAGVSPSTVSRVINGKNWVKEETKRRVLEAIESLEYIPNGFARSLSRKSTEVIGTVIANPYGSLYTDIIFSEIVNGIGEIVDQRGYSLLLSRSDGRYSGFKSLPSMLTKKLIDGMILGGYPVEEDYIKALASHNIPLVVIGRYLKEGDIFRILVDNIGGGFKATEHLIKLGHKRIAIIIGPKTLYAFEDKLRGYKMALESYGIGVDDSLIIEENNYRDEGGYNGMRRALSLNPPPTAVFIGDLLMSVGAVKYINEIGLKIPDDIAVVGYCDSEIARLMEVPLTTIDIGKRNIGNIAAKLLLDVIEGKIASPIDVKVPVELIIRDSSGRKGVMSS